MLLVALSLGHDDEYTIRGIERIPFAINPNVTCAIRGAVLGTVVGTLKHQCWLMKIGTCGL